MSASLPEDNLIHGDAVTHHMFSTVLEISSDGEENMLRSAADQRLLLQLGNQLSNISDRIQMARVISRFLEAIPIFSNFLIVEMNSSSRTIGNLLSGGQNIKPIRYKLKGNVDFPTDDPLFESMIQGRETVEFSIQAFMSSKWMTGQLKSWLKAGMQRTLVCGLWTAKEFNGLAFFFTKSENNDLEPYFALVKGVAECLSASFTSFKVVDKMRNMECQQLVETARQKSLEREKEKSILIEISNDMSAIRDKDSLLSILHNRLKKIFEFSHLLMSRTDTVSRTYTGLIFDAKSISKRMHPEYRRICEARYSIDDPVMSLVLASNAPVVFDLDELARQRGMPEWIKMNYETGVKEIVMTVLNSGSNHIGAFVVFSETKNSFLKKELNLIRGISSQLANAVDNILSQEEILTRENEKSILLSLSHDVALIRNKEDLLRFNKEKLKKVLPVSHLLIFTMMEDEKLYSPYLLDPDSVCRNHPDYAEITRHPIRIDDGISDQVFLSGQMKIFNLTELAHKMSLPDYLRMNYECGKKEVIYNALSIGNEQTGLLVLFTDKKRGMDKNELRLIQGISSQLSTAVTNIIANEKIETQIAEISDYRLQLENMNIYLQEEIDTTYNYSEIIGNSMEMNKIFHMVSQVADSQSSVLILGETGTGKELVARAIHNSSPRKDKAMVKVNCATLPVNLIESELFGHERGSFTGATERRIGKFELANNSTLFLDEIGELPLELQVKLLRALQEREIERVGGKGVIKTNVRVVAATNRNLQKEVKDGTFRADLYFRLNIFPIVLPPLRERKEDIPMLATHFLNKYSRRGNKEAMHFSNRVMKELVAYSWPGNVRELENIIERSVLLTAGTTIRQIFLPVMNQGEMEEILPDTVVKTIEEVERDHIIDILKKTNGKVSGIGGAAVLLKIPATTLSSKIRKYNIKKDSLT